MGNLRHVPTTFAEPCLDGATMQLSNGGTRTTTTTAAGYGFTDLPAATYTLTLFSLPGGFSAAGAIPGSLGGSAVDATTLSGIVLPAGGTGTGYDFAVRRD
jgi:hypothetical protein